MYIHMFNSNYLNVPPKQSHIYSTPLPTLWYFRYRNIGIPFWCILDYLFWTMNPSVFTDYLWHCKINCIKWLHCTISSPNEIPIKVYEMCLKLVFISFYLIDRRHKGEEQMLLVSFPTFIFVLQLFFFAGGSHGNVNFKQ